MESKNMTKKDFKKEIYKCNNAKELHYLLLNILILILHNGYYYCYCDKKIYVVAWGARRAPCVKFRQYLKNLRKNLTFSNVTSII